MKYRGALHRAWWACTEAGIPTWAWRWYCGLRGRHDSDSYGACAICGKPEPEPERDFIRLPPMFTRVVKAKVTKVERAKMNYLYDDEENECDT